MGWPSVELPHKPLMTSRDPYNLPFTFLKFLHFSKVTEERSHTNTWRMVQCRDKVMAQCRDEVIVRISALKSYCMVPCMTLCMT